MKRDPERDTAIGNALVVGTRAVTAAGISLIPVVGSPVSVFMTEIAIERLDRAVKVIEAAIEEAAHARSLDVETFLEQVSQRPELRALLVTASNATSATADEHILQVGARLLKEGLADDAAVDESRLLLATLYRLEPAHLRVLATISRSFLDLDQTERVYVPLPVTIKALEEKWPAGVVVLPAVLAVLEGAGLIDKVMFSVAQLRDPTIRLATDNQEGWTCTVYGRRLCEFVES